MTQKTRPKTDLKNTAPIAIQAWIAWSIVTFFYAFQYVLRVFPSIMIDDIRLKYALDAQQFGDFSGAYYLGYAIMHIPVGLLLDHKSPRWIVALSMGLCSIGILPLFLSDSWELAVAGRFLLGAGSSTAILGVFKIIRLNFPTNKTGTMLGFSVMVGLIGAIYGGGPVQDLVSILGWQQVLYGFTIFGFILAFITLFFIPKRTKPRESTATGSIAKDLRIAFKTPYVLSTAFLAALMVGPNEGFADVWGTPFFTHVYNFPKEIASYLPSLIFFGMGFGAPFLAYIGDRTNAHKKIVKFSALIMGVLFVFLLKGNVSLTGSKISLFVIGIFCAYQVLVMHINGMRVEAKYSGIVTAITNMIIMSFGYVFHHFIGRTVNDSWAGEVIDNVRIYPMEAYTNGLMIIPAGLFLAFIGFYGEEIHARLKKQRRS